MYVENLGQSGSDLKLGIVGQIRMAKLGTVVKPFNGIASSLWDLIGKSDLIEKLPYGFAALFRLEFKVIELRQFA